ncbi:maltose alpha-D-glucosyltransferase [Saccharicrinis sp. FJH54]|uniref:maltose alpha-D-glucosyltransferase n=1 Tax=Saccharicrinis sp. FJH54 TaxID=3344665 RepID=UPI0035D43D02
MKNQTRNSASWYKDAVIYQCHVRSFMDSNGDGIGDFNGLIQRLDYLQSLGINAIWLLPFYKSPLKDGGYDISDFTSIHEDYGTMADFKRFIREAHKRHIRVITELVLNHTSSAHKWFERARTAKPGSVYRDFYVWSDTNDKYTEARIIFQDFELSNWSWDPVAKAYYWHRFYSHQPDLNFDNPSVHKAILKVLDFWFGIGVDGLRLDAVPYLYERENTNCENLPETHDFLKKLRTYIDDNFEDKMLLAEANQWPEDSSAYFGIGDECHMAFHFPLMPRLYMSMKMEDRFPLIDILEQTPAIPKNCQWAIFLRNHDELTLEMVTDEERDYMYKAFAKNPKQRINLGIRRRLAPLLENDRKSIELMNVLLFSMPGTPIIYYGDEIGMGDNYYLGDRDGVRTPMQWSADKNAGFSTAEPQQLFLPVVFNYDYHYESINVENFEKNSTSLLWWMRRVINVRKQFKAFSRGDIEFIDTNNPRILAFTRTYEDEVILVIINLSRYSQNAQLDLRKYAGYIPTEVFSRNAFSLIGEEPYVFPLQYKNYFWFQLKKQETENDNKPVELDYKLDVTTRKWNRMSDALRTDLQGLLLEYMQKNRWFKGRSRKIRKIDIVDTVPFRDHDIFSYLLIIEITYIENSAEFYVIPVSVSLGDEAADIRYTYPEAIISSINIDGREGLLYDGSYKREFMDDFLRLMAQKGKLKTAQGELQGFAARQLAKTMKQAGEELQPRVISAEQSNTSVQYGNTLFLKLYRRPEEGVNPEEDIVKALSNNRNFKNSPGYAGSIEYKRPWHDSMLIGILTDYITNEETAWQYTVSAIDKFFDHIVSQKEQLLPAYAADDPATFVPDDDEVVRSAFDPLYMQMVALLGQRTAEMHKALASVKNDNSFAEEKFSLLYQKSLYQSFRTTVKRNFSKIKASRGKLDPAQQTVLDEILSNESSLLSAVKTELEAGKMRASKLKIHGNYHLGQILFTGKDFMITDFEGEKERTLSARNLKYCPLKDVANLLRSFHYAVYMGFETYSSRMPEHAAFLEPWRDIWHNAVRDTLLKSYLETAGNASFIPDVPHQTDILLTLFTIEKAVDEAVYELENRPEWLHMPLNGLRKVIHTIIE